VKAGGRTVIRAVVVDDHPAMRAGIAAVLERAPDITLVGQAAGARELWPILRDAAPDVVVMDFHLGDEDDGVVLCHRIKQLVDAPRVVLYSAFADASLMAPALIARADALLAKRAPAEEFYRAIRDVAMTPAGPRAELPDDQRKRLNAMLQPEEIGLVGLLLLGTPPSEIVRTIGRRPGDLAEHTERILRRVTGERARLA
jgi:DNA-binding NarL/FixJ family response regulator